MVLRLEISFEFSGSCDNCCGSGTVQKDVATDAMTLLLCIKETEGRFGLNLPINVLRGSNVNYITVEFIFDIF
jgi:ATP-dependent DNA helicase RecQ